MAYTSKYSGTEIDAGVAQAKTNKADITSLRSLITGNQNSIASLQTSVNGIKNETIPTLQASIGEKALASDLESFKNETLDEFADIENTLTQLTGSVATKVDQAFVNDRIKTTVETHINPINEAINNLTATLEEQEVSISTVQSGITTVSTNLQTNVTRIDSQITAINTNLENQKNTNTAVQNSLTNLTDTKANSSDLDPINNTLQEHTTAINNISQDYITSTELESNLSDYVDRENLSTTLASYATNDAIETIEQKFELYVTIETYEKKIAELQKLIEDLTDQVNKLEENIDNNPFA